MQDPAKPTGALEPSGRRTRCNICGFAFDSGPCRLVPVRCNVRRFSHEVFHVWRCPDCRCIHCWETVDLPHYYEGYGTKDQRLDFFSRLAYARQLSRLRAAGLTKHHRLLDYGCGSGNLVTYLRSRRYAGAVGYDPYGDPGGAGDPSILEREPFDFVILQDVIEHVEDPKVLLARIAGWLHDDGVLMVGTPSADEIDVDNTYKHLHQLHVPYHLHLYTKNALVGLGRTAGLHPFRFYHRFYAETTFFGMNEAFCRAYLARLDDNIEALVEPGRVGMVLRSPVLLFHGFFGYWYSPRHSITLLYRKHG